MTTNSKLHIHAFKTLNEVIRILGPEATFEDYRKLINRMFLDIWNERKFDLYKHNLLR
jgi:hypothetical protein